MFDSNDFDGSPRDSADESEDTVPPRKFIKVESETKPKAGVNLLAHEMSGGRLSNLHVRETIWLPYLINARRKVLERMAYMQEK